MYKKYCISKIKNKISNNNAKIEYRNSENSFIRDRKMNFEKVILYGLNKRGLTSKMEIEDFTELVNMTDISAPAVLKQRLKLNGKIYLDMMQENLKGFYTEFKSEVKLFHGYILSAIDGSDFEIPNTQKSRDEFGIMCHEFSDMTKELSERNKLATLLSDHAVEALSKNEDDGVSTSDVEVFNGTALVTDIRNFTGMCEKYTPEQITDLLNKHFACRL